MKAENHARKQGGELELDLCYSCQLLWFDQHESTQLAPGAVVNLFEQIHSHRTGAEALAEKLSCVRCNETLRLAQDTVRGTRFVYYRCLNGHGRLISFWHFLREKQFVRDLSAQERQQLAHTVAQVKCGSCGGPVDIRHDAACTYCRAPLAVLDSAAVEQALAKFRQEAARPVEVVVVDKSSRRINPGSERGVVIGDAGAGTLDTGVEVLDMLGTGISVLWAVISD
ncbi:hypothetical protein [Chitinimonas arctica]|nr:hypothetical protein [Chitinimonas arctica]